MSERDGRRAELDAGALALSGHLGKTIQRLRKAYNLSLSELAEQSGVAKSIISQIERNETNPTLATIWRLCQALDISIERVLAAHDDEPFVDVVARADTPVLVSEDGKVRLAIIGWMQTVEWLQWYALEAEPGGELEIGRPPARLDRVPFGQRRGSGGRGLRPYPARGGGRHRALPLRPPPRRPQRRRHARPRHHGVHHEGRGDGVAAQATARFRAACHAPSVTS